eukprot:COSAG02_NODE_12726_length_1501_cov_1.220798_2_plen_108_part_00
MTTGGKDAADSQCKGKAARIRLGAVKAKVVSLQLMLSESASMSSCTTTRYMRASDTNRGTLAEQLRMGTPTPPSRHRESLYANLMQQGVSGGQSATSIFAPVSPGVE